MPATITQSGLVRDEAQKESYLGARTRRRVDAGTVDQMRQQAVMNQHMFRQQFQRPAGPRRRWADAGGRSSLALPQQPGVMLGAGGPGMQFAASHAGHYAGLGVRGVLGRFYRKHEEQIGGMWARDIGFFQPSDQEIEPYRMTGAQYQMQPWSGERQARQKAVYNYSIQNEVFEMSDEFPTDDFRRDKTGQIMGRVGDMARVASEHWEEIGTELIESGTTALAYDSNAFFGTRTIAGNTVKNNLTSSDIPELAIGSDTAPTQAEFAKIIAAGIQAMVGWKDEAGRPVNGGAREFVVMVSPNMMAAAFGATVGELLLAGESNVLRNMMRGKGFSVRVIVNAFLTTTNVIHLFRTDTESRAIILQSEVDVTARAIGLGTEHEVKNRSVFFTVEAVRNVGFGEFYRALRMTTSTSGS